MNSTVVGDVVNYVCTKRDASVWIYIRCATGDVLVNSLRVFMFIMWNWSGNGVGAVCADLLSMAWARLCAWGDVLKEHMRSVFLITWSTPFGKHLTQAHFWRVHHRSCTHSTAATFQDVPFRFWSARKHTMNTQEKKCWQYTSRFWSIRHPHILEHGRSECVRNYIDKVVSTDS